jgi:hypothetical protein
MNSATKSAARINGRRVCISFLNVLFGWDALVSQKVIKAGVSTIRVSGWDSLLPKTAS